MRRLAIVALLLLATGQAIASCSDSESTACHNDCLTFGVGPGIYTVGVCSRAIIPHYPGSWDDEVVMTCNCYYRTEPEPEPPLYGPSCSPEDGGNYSCYTGVWSQFSDGTWGVHTATTRITMQQAPD